MSGGIEMLGELREPGGPNALSLAGGQVATRFTLCRGARNSVTSHPTHTHLGTPWGPQKGTLVAAICVEKTAQVSSLGRERVR